MGKKASAPKPDKRIGEAALKTAQVGEDYLGWMKEQAKVSNQWAEEDRTRYKETFEPLQDQFIEEAQGYDTPARRKAEAMRATADVRQRVSQANGARRRQMTAMGVDPTSGRFATAERSAAIDAGLAEAGAANTARRSVEQQGRSLRAAAVDLGSGMAVNPATSLGMSNSAISAGAQGAMQGHSSMASTLQQQDNFRMQGYQQEQNALGQFYGAVGNVAGAALGGSSIFSSKELKTDKTPVKRSLTKQLRDMPVEDWTYKKGVADEGRHTGPYAEDWQKATGKGDGKTIDMIDAVGVTMGAVQELDRKVTKLGRQLSRQSAPPRTAQTDGRQMARKAANGGRQLTRRAA